MVLETEGREMKNTSGKSAEEKALIHRIDLNLRIIKREGDRLRRDGIRVSEHIRILEARLRRVSIGTGGREMRHHFIVGSVISAVTLMSTVNWLSRTVWQETATGRCIGIALTLVLVFASLFLTLYCTMAAEYLEIFIKRQLYSTKLQCLSLRKRMVESGILET